jgi:DNA gyrase subunit B/topoisomerase-4 subunit B
MPMSGKILNVQNLEGHKILKSEKIKEILCAIGADLSSTSINVDKLNYDRYVILADADSDGQGIDRRQCLCVRPS